MRIDEQKEMSDKNINKSASGKQNTNMLLAAFMIFVLPLISISLGAFLGGYVGQTINVPITMSQVLGGIAGFILSAVAIKLFDKYSKVDKNAKKIEWDDL